MSIWQRDVSLERLNKLGAATAIETMGVVITAVGDNTVTAEMPVDERTKQPAGLLHGGASVVLAETLASTGAVLASPEGSSVVGLEINANHVGGVKDGTVIGVATAGHIGRTTQVWDVRIHHKESGKLVCISRMTAAILSA